MKESMLALVVALVVIAVGAVVFITTPGLQAADVKNTAKADLLAETARRQLDQYIPGMALIEAFLAEADWLAGAGEFDRDALRVGIEARPEDLQHIDQVIRDLNTAYDRGSPRAPEGSVELLVAWGFPEGMIEDLFHFAGESGKREIELRRQAARDLPSPAVPMMRGVGTSPEQQARALAEAVDRIRTKYKANRDLLEGAAAALRQALAFSADHVPANRLMAMVEYQQAMHKRYEALGLRNEAERLRPLLRERLGAMMAVTAQIDAIRDARDIEGTTRQLAETLDELDHRIREQRETVKQLEGELGERQQLVEARRAEAERLRDAYELTAAATYDANDPDSFAAHLREIERAGRSLSEAETALDVALHGTITGIRPANTADLVDGAYVPAEGQPQHDRGVAAIERELATARARLERTEAAHQDALVRHSQLEEVRAQLDEELARKQQRIADLRNDFRETLAESEQVLTDAEAAESAARETHLAGAARFLAAARRGSDSRMSAARTAQGTAADYLKLQSQERWLAAGLVALEGEVQLLLASVNLQEADDLRSHVRTLKAAAEAGVPGIDLPAAEEKLEDARRAAAEAAHQAAERFNEALRNDNQWVYQANAGVALSMLARIDPTNQDYRRAASEALRAVTEARGNLENATGWARVATERLSSLLARLEEQPGPASTSGDDENAES